MASYSKSHQPQSSPQPLTSFLKTFPRKKRSPRIATRLAPLQLSSPSIKGGSSRIGESVLPHQSRRSSGTFTLVLGNGETPVRLKKTVANENLAEIAKVDPKKAKRILANRQSVARCKHRQSIRELEKKVERIQQILNAASLMVAKKRANPVWLENLTSERRIEFEDFSKFVEEKARIEANEAEIRRLKDMVGYRF